MSGHDGRCETTQNANIAAFTNVRALQKCDPGLIQECAKVSYSKNVLRCAKVSYSKNVLR